MNIIAVRQVPPAQPIPRDERIAWDAWVATRPRSVKILIAEFPPGTEIDTDEGSFYLLGYTEDDRLIVSPLEPYNEYDAARAAQQYICAEHLRTFLRNMQ